MPFNRVTLFCSQGATIPRPAPGFLVEREVRDFTIVIHPFWYGSRASRPQVGDHFLCSPPSPRLLPATPVRTLWPPLTSVTSLCPWRTQRLKPNTFNASIFPTKFAAEAVDANAAHSRVFFQYPCVSGMEGIASGIEKPYSQLQVRRGRSGPDFRLHGRFYPSSEVADRHHGRNISRTNRNRTPTSSHAVTRSSAAALSSASRDPRITGKCASVAKAMKEDGRPERTQVAPARRGGRVTRKSRSPPQAFCGGHRVLQVQSCTFAGRMLRVTHQRPLVRLVKDTDRFICRY